MSCEEVRECLADHLFGSLATEADAQVRAHLRGCSGCRADLRHLGEGLSAFAAGTHDRRPPLDLQDRVMGVLEEEWREVEPAVSPALHRPAWRAVAAVAATFVLIAALSWGTFERHRAGVLVSQAANYRTLLSNLGGRDFRSTRLVPAGAIAVEGSVIVYDSMDYQSWAAVFVRAPGVSGEVTATLSTPGGRTIAISPITIQPDGSGSGWIVSASDLTTFTDVTLRSASGVTLATGTIQD
jgi:hypothetical protein